MRKGRVEVITLAIGMIPMTLMIVLSGYLITETVDTDLQAQMDLKYAEFESLMALSHVLNYKNTSKDINRYSEFPDNPSSLRGGINTQIEESTEYLDITNQNIDPMDANPYLAYLNDRRFMVNVTVPEKDDLSTSSSDTSRVFIQAKTSVASPQPEPVTVSVMLND